MKCPPGFGAILSLTCIASLTATPAMAAEISQPSAIAVSAAPSAQLPNPWRRHGYALAAYTPGDASGMTEDPSNLKDPNIAALATLGLCWVPILGPTAGYIYAGEPMRGVWVGLGQPFVVLGGLLLGGLGGLLLGGYVGGSAGSKSGTLGTAVGFGEGVFSGAAIGMTVGGALAYLGYTAWSGFDVYATTEWKNRQLAGAAGAAGRG